MSATSICKEEEEVQLKVEDKTQVSAYLLKKCQFCKDLESEKEKILDELCEMPSETIEEYKAKSEKIRESSRISRELDNVKEQIVKCLIEELGI